MLDAGQASRYNVITMPIPNFTPAQIVTLTMTNGTSEGLEVVSASEQNVELKSLGFGYTVKLGWSPVVDQWIVLFPAPPDRRTAPARVISSRVTGEVLGRAVNP